MTKILVAALYKFARVPEPQALAEQLRTHGAELGVLGTLLVAREGINGTIAAAKDAIGAMLEGIRAQPALAALEAKFSWVDETPFRRLKVHVKPEIVTMGVPDVDPTTRVGTYLTPAQWNQLLQNEDVVLLDTRNDYEVQMGTFKGALNPKTTTFREFPTFVRQNLDPATHKKVAMFCTGGIRCEKASSFMLGEGFEEVYHLQGGILKYLETMPQEQSLWQGDCFVFDRRVAVDHTLAPGEHTICDQCQRPLCASDRAAPTFEQDVSCPHCFAETTYEQKRALRARAKILRPIPAPLRAR